MEQYLGDGKSQPGGASATTPGPFDVLHIDLNGYIHVAMRSPDDSAKASQGPPEQLSETEIFSRVVDAIERLTARVRPTRLLHLSMDGVAPRAKMNQQRSRRFKKAHERQRDADVESKVRDARSRSGKPCPPPGDVFDSNQISAGTAFMHRFSKYLRSAVRSRRRDADRASIFARVAIIFSDTLCPGEGEHKILAFIRAQAAELSHLVVGDDADLILLGLACRRRAPRFYVLRGRHRAEGYDVIDVAGVARELGTKLLQDAVNATGGEGAAELDPASLDTDRLVDDFIYISFLIGNDFIPPIPSIDIFSGGLDVLLALYARQLRRGAPGRVKYIVDTRPGDATAPALVDPAAARALLQGLSSVERAMVENKFLTHHDDESKPKRTSSPRTGGRGRGHTGKKKGKRNSRTPSPRFRSLRSEIDFAISEAQRAEYLSLNDNTLHCMVGLAYEASVQAWGASAGDSKAIEAFRKQYGWRWQYYALKFQRFGDAEGIPVAAEGYSRALNFILQYYFKGLPAWDFYYPAHYAPFARELSRAKDKAFTPEWSLGAPPTPITQLMAILPPESASALPQAIAALVRDPRSAVATNAAGEIIYPRGSLLELTDAMGEARRPWHWVVRLPFVDMKTLQAVVRKATPSFSPEEQDRNAAPVGFDYLLPRVKASRGGRDRQRIIPAAAAALTATILLRRLRRLALGPLARAATTSLVAYVVVAFVAWCARAIAGGRAKAIEAASGKDGKVAWRPTLGGCVAGLQCICGQWAPSTDGPDGWLSYRMPKPGAPAQSLGPEAGASSLPGTHGQRRRSRNRTNRRRRRSRRRGPTLGKLLAFSRERSRPLAEQLRQQVEYWLGDNNFARDKFLKSLQVTGDSNGDDNSLSIEDCSDATSDSGRIAEPNPKAGTGWIPLAKIVTFRRLVLFLADFVSPEDKTRVLAQSLQGSNVVAVSACGGYIRRCRPLSKRS